MSTNIEVFKGDSVILKVAVTLNGVAVNITNFLVRFAIKIDVLDSDAAALIIKDVDSGVTLTDPTNGKAEIALTPTDTGSLGRMELNYAVKIKDVSGNIHTVLEGTFTAVPLAVVTL